MYFIGKITFSIIFFSFLQVFFNCIYFINSPKNYTVQLLQLYNYTLTICAQTDNYMNM